MVIPQNFNPRAPCGARHKATGIATNPKDFNPRAPCGARHNAAFDALWEYLKAHSVDDCVLLEAADGQSTISYEAYYTSASRKLRRVYNGVNYWDALDVNFIPMDPQVTP